MISKMVKKGQKNKVFWTFLENQVISFVWIWCKINVLMILRELNASGKNLVLKLKPKIAQYSLIVIISLVD